MTTSTDLVHVSAAMQRTMISVGQYFGIDQPGPDADPDDWIGFSARIGVHLRQPSDTIARLRRTAEYVEQIESEWSSAQAEERSAKANLIEALIEAIRPALSAISDPIISHREFIKNQEKRSMMPIRGLVLIDGWRRDINGSTAPVLMEDAGRSVVLLEDGTISIFEHTARRRSQDQYVVYTDRCQEQSVEQIIASLDRRMFIEMVTKIVSTVIDLSRNPKRKEQVRESQDLADKLSAVRVLLEGSR